MENMYAIARAAIDQAPPACRVRPEDAEIIQRHSEALVALGPEVVAAFYDTLFGHGVTAEVFAENERPMREKTLAQWWGRTARGPIDEEYFAWMAMVGLVHVLRRVTNPMMLAMADFVAGFVADNASRITPDPAEQERLTDAFSRLAASVSAIITWGYDQAISSALFEVVGMPEALLARLRDAEIRDALDQARIDLSV